MIATLCLQFGGFSTQMACSTSLGQQRCKRLVSGWQNGGKCWCRWCCIAGWPSQRWLSWSGPKWPVHFAKACGQG